MSWQEPSMKSFCYSYFLSFFVVEGEYREPVDALLCEVMISVIFTNESSPCVAWCGQLYDVGCVVRVGRKIQCII